MKREHTYEHIPASDLTCVAGAIIAPILQMKSLRHRELRDLITRDKASSAGPVT